MLEMINDQLEMLRDRAKAAWRLGESYYRQGLCQVLSHGPAGWEVLFTGEDEEEVELRILQNGKACRYVCEGKELPWDGSGVAALLKIREELGPHGRPPGIGRTYTRDGMIKRVIEERREKAEKTKYRISFADNIYGEHTLVNEKGVKYKVTLRDFEQETGYIDNPDLKTNKLGTTKHIMYAFAALKAKPATYKRLSKRYPFVEIYLDPLHDYRITWHYPHALRPRTAALVKKFFGKKHYISEAAVKDFLGFISAAGEHPIIKIRPEVEEKVQQAWEKETLQAAERQAELDFSLLKVPLFSYQAEGVRFATFRQGAIIADEMGLGKTIQAIATAIMKKELFGFRKCLIVCPASLKAQWKSEISKFCHEEALVVEGFPRERRAIYREGDAYFIIVNYETVLRDLGELNRMAPDFVILDEAQRIKNFSTITAQNIKQLQRKHALVITGTPIENRLTDLYSVMQFVDPRFLAPLWEFAYRHCYFDEEKKDKITGYHHLKELNEKLKEVLLRREKRHVLKALPTVSEMTVPVSLHPVQADYHAGFASGVASILHKKYISPFDMQKLMLLLNNMRMVCDSSYLIDKETFHSPKLEELRHILVEKLDLLNSDRKVIIFSEWTRMLGLIGQMLQAEGIGYVQLSGQVAVKHRSLLVKKFETSADCKVFLSTEAGGSGLNLQVADTVINFELPWNPAKKNQRIGRIDRLGQRKEQLTVINLVTRNSFELSIASGLVLKQHLFDGVLGAGTPPDEVDFSADGKAQFLSELETIIEGLAAAPAEEWDMTETAEAQREETLEAAITEEEEPASSGAAAPEPAAAAAMMEQVLNQGMEFLSGLFKMATGKDLGLESRRAELDRDTGEVVLRFKWPTT